MAPTLNSKVSESVWRSLNAERARTGETLSQVVDRTISEFFDLDRHSLFQVSTSKALVQGVFGAAVTIADLKRHGDFGLGTFESLDGELIMLDGVCYRATTQGLVTLPDDEVGTPFAVVTRFRSDLEETVGPIETLRELTTSLDDARPSENIFVGVRVDAEFDRLSLRAACHASPGESLVEATSHQSEFEASDIKGTLVGFWAPKYVSSISVPGYHLHFISSDRSLGGHVFDVTAERAEVSVHVESDLHIAIPESSEFLEADLAGDHRPALDLAESTTNRGVSRDARDTETT